MSHLCTINSIGVYPRFLYNVIMPTTPRDQCSIYRCKQPTRPGSSMCIDHAPPPRVNMIKRANDREYKTAVWQTIRAGQLSKQPLCQSCQLAGRVTLGVHVDHVIGWKTIGPGAFVNNLFQTLCGPCHSVKTGFEQRGVFRHYSDRGAIDYQSGDWPQLISDNDPARAQ
jgi:5-methylcytosine-specific restriction protein A